VVTCHRGALNHSRAATTQGYEMKTLACLALAMISTGALAQDKRTVIGAWGFEVVSDPMTDARRGIAATDIKNTITLIVKCDGNGQNTVYMSFLSDDYLGGTSSSKYRDISYRLDGAPAQTITGWYDGKTANLLDLKPTNAAGRFLKAVAGTNKLTIQLTDFEGASHVAVIDTTGGKTAILKVAETCGDTNMAQFLSS
jgi:hypothetical protein